MVKISKSVVLLLSLLLLSSVTVKVIHSQFYFGRTAVIKNKIEDLKGVKQGVINRNLDQFAVIIASAGVTLSTTVPVTVNFCYSGSDSPTSHIVQYQWDFDGNGIFDYNSAVSGNTSHTYNSVGTYPAKLKVTDDQGGFAERVLIIDLYVSKEITVIPGADTTISTVYPVTVNLTAQAYAAGGTITKYEWDYDGKGTFTDATATSGNVSHSYTAASINNADLRVTDNHANTAKKSILIAVVDPDALLYAQGLQAYTSGQYSLALTRFQNQIIGNPSSTRNDDAQFGIGKSYYQMVASTPPSTYPQARTELQKVISNYPTSGARAEAQYYIGKSYYQEKNYSTAITEFQKVLNNYPTSLYDDNAQLYIGKCYYSMAELTPPQSTFDQARTEFQKVLNNYTAATGAPEAQYYIGKCFYKQNNFTQAYTEFKKTLDNYPGRIFLDYAQLYIGKCYLSQNNYGQAVIELQKAFINYPGSLSYDDVQLNIGESYYRAKNFSQAIIELQIVLDKYAQSLLCDNALYYQILAYCDWGNKTAATNKLNELTAKYPSSTYISQAQSYINSK